MNIQKQNKLVSAALTIALGVLFILLKGQVVSIAMTVLGVALIVLAVLDLTHNLITPAVVKAVVGVVVLVFGWAFISVALYIMGALLLIYGVLQVISAFRAAFFGKNILLTVLSLVEPAICIFAGVCLFFNQGGAIAWVFTVSGVFLIIDGILALVQGIASK